MGLYDYEKQSADLTDKYNNDNVVNQYAHFISKQRYARNRQDQDMGYQRAFPQFTGNYAHQLGSGIKSGVFGSKLNEFVGDYNRGADRLNQDEAGEDANYNQTTTMGAAQYQKALLMLQEELKKQQATQDPYAAYTSVYGGPSNG